MLAPNKKDAPKEGPANNVKGTPTISKSATGKRELNREDAKASDGAPPKKVKIENMVLNCAQCETKFGPNLIPNTIQNCFFSDLGREKTTSFSDHEIFLCGHFLDDIISTVLEGIKFILRVYCFRNEVADAF